MLDRLYSKYPDYNYHLLVRNDEQAEKIKNVFPKAKIVRGTLEDWQIVNDAARRADIVIGKDVKDFFNVDPSDCEIQIPPNLPTACQGRKLLRTASLQAILLKTLDTGSISPGRLF